MNPDTALKRVRDLVMEIERTEEADRVVDLSVELVEAIDNLDKWISTGGALPSDWAAEEPELHAKLRWEEGAGDHP